MSVKNKIIIFIISFLVSLYFFSLYPNTKELEIVELGDGIHAHKYVQDYIKDHNLRTDDVIVAYNEAMSKRNKEEEKMIVEERKDFSLLISIRNQMIVSIESNTPFQAE